MPYLQQRRMMWVVESPCSVFCFWALFKHFLEMSTFWAIVALFWKWAFFVSEHFLMYRRKVQAQLTSAVPHLAIGNAVSLGPSLQVRVGSVRCGRIRGNLSPGNIWIFVIVLQCNTKAAHLDNGPSSWTLLDICIWNFETDSFGFGRFLIHLTRPKREPCQSGRRRKEQQGFFAAMTSTWRARYRCLASATSWPGENVTFNVGQEVARASIHLLQQVSTDRNVCVCLQTIERILWADPVNSHFATVQPALNQPCCRSHVWQDSLWTVSTVAETTCAQQKCRVPSAESSPTHQRLLSAHPTAGKRR